MRACRAWRTDQRTPKRVSTLGEAEPVNETPDQHPRKHALLIGIDRYPLFPEKNQLTTCVADIELMAAVLRERFGFAPDRIRRLLNADATYDGICAAMAR